MWKPWSPEQTLRGVGGPSNRAMYTSARVTNQTYQGFRQGVGQGVPAKTNTESRVKDIVKLILYYIASRIYIYLQPPWHTVGQV
jgi:hypothetical protein